MTEHNKIGRRTFIGSLAALSAGKATGYTANSDQNGADTDSGVETNSDHLGDYANRVGRINHQGLNQALADWQNNVINRTELDAVRNAFRTGERVVDKTVVELSNNINEQTLLEKNPNDSSGDAVVYRVTNSISVNAELTIEPGVLMEFTQGTRININGGSIKAEGTSSEEIFMTATNARPGWWDGMYIQSGDLTNRIQHLLMEYGGRGLRGNISIATGAGDSGQLELSNTELRWSDSHGLYLSSSATLLGGSGENTYKDNREGPVRVVTSNVAQLSPSSDFTGNDRNYVLVDSNTLSGSGADEDKFVWDNLNVPYQMAGYHNVNDAELEIVPGTRLEFAQQATLDFNSGSRITIEGTESEPITMTGTTERRGWWNGVYVQTTDTENTMYHTVVEYAANRSNSWGGNIEMGTGAGDSAVLELQNSTFRQAAGFGIYLGDGCDLGNTQNNTYTSNADGAARVGTENIEMLSDTSTFTGNDNDYVLVADRNVSGGGRDNDVRTWDSLDVPYRMDGYHNVNDLELVINPGATFEFTEQAALDFNGGARMSISGIDDDAPEGEMINPITFTGTDKQRGWWRGIYVQTTDTENIMEKVIVEYAGADGWTGQLVMGTGAGDSGRVKLLQSTFRNGETYGVRTAEGSDDLSGSEFNTYTGNKKGALQIRTEQVEMLSDNSTFTGNDNDHVLVNGTNINGSGASSDLRNWEALNVPYRIAGNANINNVELQIDPGATFEFTESSSLVFNDGCRMIVSGIHDDTEEVDRITFTGTQKDRGWWKGIYFETVSQINTFEYVTIEYGGSDWTGMIDMATGAGDNALIQNFSNCIVRNSGSYGINLTTDADIVNMSNNTFTGNTKAPINTPVGRLHQLSASSDFTGNDSDYIHVKSTALRSGNVPSGQNGVTWENLNVPYQMKPGNHGVEGVELTIEEGTTFEFESDGQLYFNGTSAIMDIVGTSDNPITFTSTRDFKGWWDGIYIDSDNVANQMVETVVENAGRDLAGAITLGTGAGDEGYITLENSTIQKSQSSGIYVDSDSTANSDVCTANTFIDNDGEDCSVN